jgi:hypothetical protein
MVRDGAMPPLGPSVWTGRALQAKNDDLEVMVLRFCIRPVSGTIMFLAIRAATKTNKLVTCHLTGVGQNRQFKPPNRSFGSA